MCMEHAHHTAELAAYLPLLMGGIAGLFGLACVVLARPLFERAWCNTLYLDAREQTIAEPVFRPLAGKQTGRLICESGMGSYIYLQPLNRLDKLLSTMLGWRLGPGEGRAPSHGAHAHQAGHARFGLLPLLMLLATMVMLAFELGCTPLALPVSRNADALASRSERSYGCSRDGATWVCSITVETFRGGLHPTCRCTTRGEVAHCTCKQPVSRKLATKLATALPLEDLR